MQKNRALVYWLIPAKPERELFRDLIRILAKQFDAPVFEPHLTLTATAQDQQAARKTLRQIKAKPIRLGVRAISSSSKFTKTLFVRFVSSKSLEKLVVCLGGLSLRDPHLSLLYKKTSILTKRELVSTIKLPFREVVFDSIKAVRCVSPTEARADVEAWRAIAMKRLSA